MTRTFQTSADEDAAIAWKVALVGITEDQLIAQFASAALADLVSAYKDAEAARIYEAVKVASAETLATVKTTLGLDGDVKAR